MPRQDSGWRYHNSLKELSDWRRYAVESIRSFQDELAKHSKISPVTDKQKEAAVRIRDGLDRILSELKKIEKESKSVYVRPQRRDHSD